MEKGRELPLIFGETWRMPQMVWIPHTLYNAILRTARNFLETRENIKISTHPFYHINLGWFSWEWSKKNSKWPTQKNLIFQLPQFSMFFMKISWIGPWVSRIDWCKGHQYDSTFMAIRLSLPFICTALCRASTHGSNDFIFRQWKLAPSKLSSNPFLTVFLPQDTTMKAVTSGQHKIIRQQHTAA